MTAGERRPVLVEEEALGRVGVVEALAAHVVVAADVAGIALELADDRAGVDVVDADHAAPLGEHAERDAVGLLPRERAVPGTVQVQQRPVLARPVGHRGERRVADREVDHDHDAADLAGELGALVHLLHRAGGDVQVVALHLARRGGGSRHGLHRVQEAVAPAHERLGVDVLVVLGEVQPTAQRLVHDAAVVLGREPELGLRRRTEQRPPELVQVLALHDDPVRRALEGLHVGDRDPHVLEPQRLEGLEAEDVADDRGGQVRDGALLEEIDVVGDVGDVLTRRAGHRIHAVGLRLVVLVRRQAIGPDDGPGRRGRFARDCGGRLDRIDAVLRRDPEGRQDVGVLRDIVRSPVAHLGVRRDSSRPAVLFAPGNVSASDLHTSTVGL